MNLTFRRILELLAMLMIGDGLLAMVNPKRHCGLWEVGSDPIKDMVREFEKRPILTRVVGAVETVLGLALAEHLRPGDSKSLVDYAQENVSKAKHKLEKVSSR